MKLRIGRALGRAARSLGPKVVEVVIGELEDWLKRRKEDQDGTPEEHHPEAPQP